MNERPTRATQALLVALLCLVWGSTWWVIREGLADLPPLTAAALRFFLAATAMTGAARLLAPRERGHRPPLGLVLVHGTLNFALSYGVVYYVETQIPSSLTAILWAVYPLFQAVFSHLFLEDERIGPAHVAGGAVAFAGVALLFRHDLSRIGPEAVRAGSLLLVSPLAVAVATTVVKRRGAGCKSVLLNRDAMWWGGALLAAAALVFEREAPMRLSARAIASLVYLSIVGTVLTFGILFWLLRSAPAAKLAVIPYATPAVAVLIGWAFAREPIGPSTLAGLALVLLGVALFTWTPLGARPGQAAVRTRPGRRPDGRARRR